MKICYLDLNHPDFFEDYSYENPKRYGGGRIVPAPLMANFNNFYIASDIRSFENVNPNKIGQCRVLPWESRQAIRNGFPVKEIIQDATEYDLFFHANTNIHLNLDGLSAEQAVWSVGWSETVHPKNTHVMFFDQKNQMPIMNGEHVVHKIIIGPKIEPFQEYQKEDLIFQCTRHERCFQSKEVAELAIRHKIKTVFAGPIQHGYPLPIDNINTFYLGEISNTDKIAWNKRAKFNTQLQNWPTCATLSAKESLSYGSAIIALPIGGWPDFIKQGVNGFIINNEQEFLNAWNSRNLISQKNCYETALEHSEDKMIETLKSAFYKITNQSLL